MFLAAAGALAVPLAVPVLSPERFLSYSAALGVGEPEMERGAHAGRMPQVYGSMFGWPELAEEVARVHKTLGPQEQVKALVLARNYSEAGAIDYYGPALGLPRAISGHNSYWTWGPRHYDGEILLVIGPVPEGFAARFDSFEKRGERTCDYCVPWETKLEVWVARGLRQPVADVWPELKRYQ